MCSVWSLCAEDSMIFFRDMFLEKSSDTATLHSPVQLSKWLNGQRQSQLKKSTTLHQHSRQLSHFSAMQLRSLQHPYWVRPVTTVLSAGCSLNQNQQCTVWSEVSFSFNFTRQSNLTLPLTHSHLTRKTEEPCWVSEIKNMSSYIILIRPEPYRSVNDEIKAILKESLSIIILRGLRS